MATGEDFTSQSRPGVGYDGISPVTGLCQRFDNTSFDTPKGKLNLSDRSCTDSTLTPHRSENLVMALNDSSTSISADSSFLSHNGGEFLDSQEIQYMDENAVFSVEELLNKTRSTTVTLTTGSSSHSSSCLLPCSSYPTDSDSGFVNNSDSSAASPFCMPSKPAPRTKSSRSHKAFNEGCTLNFDADDTFGKRSLSCSDSSSLLSDPSQQFQLRSRLLPRKSSLDLDSSPSLLTSSSPARKTSFTRVKKRAFCLDHSVTGAALDSSDSGFAEQPKTPKRRRMFGSEIQNGPATISPVKRTKLNFLQRSQSESCFTGLRLDRDRVDRAISSIDAMNLVGNSCSSHSLPTLKEHDFGIRWINCETLCKLIRGDFKYNYRILDCRFPFEYSGGHIQDAENIFRPEDVLDKLYYPQLQQDTPTTAPLVIFHCEFSSERAPKLAKFLRTFDREVNLERKLYPHLFFPELYVLKGGYRSFFKKRPDLCHPCAYIKMCDPTYKLECQMYQKLSKDWEKQHSLKKHSRLERSQSQIYSSRSKPSAASNSVTLMRV